MLHTIVCPCGSEHTAKKDPPYKYSCPDCGRFYKVFKDLTVVYQPGDIR